MFVRTLERPGAEVADGCTDPDILRAIVENWASSAIRIAALRHVAACTPCQRDLALLGQVASPSPGSGHRLDER
jgi:hypothetical protein